LPNPYLTNSETAEKSATNPEEKREDKKMEETKEQVTEEKEEAEQ